MKPTTGLFLSSALALAALCQSGCGSATPTLTDAKTGAATANLQSVTFYVDGMV